MKRRTEITIEIDRVLACSKRGSHEAWCATSGQEASLITASEAAVLADTTLHSIFQRAESGELHSSVSPAGALLICLSSLVHAGDSNHNPIRINCYESKGDTNHEKY